MGRAGFCVGDGAPATTNSSFCKGAKQNGAQGIEKTGFREMA
jgi:hypothetical protein